jgi:hypothetical protein
MENHDFKSPVSIMASGFAFVAGLLSLESWGIIVGIFCAIATTITAVRRNRAQERFYETKMRGQVSKGE